MLGGVYIFFCLDVHILGGCCSWQVLVFPLVGLLGDVTSLEGSGHLCGSPVQPVSFWLRSSQFQPHLQVGQVGECGIGTPWLMQKSQGKSDREEWC